MIKRKLRQRLSAPVRARSAAGATLVELLVGMAISALFVPLVWATIRGAIQFYEATVWQVQLGRDLDRLATLLNAEAEEACLFGTTAAPDDCGAPDPCPAAAGQLQLGTRLLDASDNPTAPAVIIYALSNGELRRSGPRILANGRLDPDDTAADQLVMRRVTGFTVTPSDDCNTVSIEVTVEPPAPNVFMAASGAGNPVSRRLGLRTGSRPLQLTPDV